MGNDLLTKANEQWQMGEGSYVLTANFSGPLFRPPSTTRDGRFLGRNWHLFEGIAFRGPKWAISKVFQALFCFAPDFIIFKEISAKKILCPDQDFLGPAISASIDHARCPVFQVQLAPI